MNLIRNSLLIFMVFVFAVPALAQEKTGIFAQKAKKPRLRSGYDVIHPFKKGMAKVEKDKKQGFIHDNGEEFVTCKYDCIYPWENGRAKVEINEHFGFINEQGEEYIPVKYDYIGPFKNGLAIVSLDGRRGLINEQGEEVVTLDK